MNKEEHNTIIDFVNSDDYMLLNSYISKPYEETIIEQDKEIERLNNIIDELEKFFEYEYDNEVRPLNDRKISVWTICLDKLKELKDKNE